MKQMKVECCFFADAFDFRETMQRRPANFSKIAKNAHEVFCDRFDVAPRDGVEEEEFEQLIILQSHRAAVSKARAQSITMFRIMRLGCRRTRNKAGSVNLRAMS